MWVVHEKLIINKCWPNIIRDLHAYIGLLSRQGGLAPVAKNALHSPSRII